MMSAKNAGHLSPFHRKNQMLFCVKSFALSKPFNDSNAIGWWSEGAR